MTIREDATAAYSAESSALQTELLEAAMTFLESGATTQDALTVAEVNTEQRSGIITDGDLTLQIRLEPGPGAEVVWVELVDGQWTERERVADLAELGEYLAEENV